MSRHRSFRIVQTAIAVLAAVAGLCLSASVASVFAQYTHTGATTQAVSSGVIDVTLTDVGSAHLTDSLTGLWPGDTNDRAVEVTNAGTRAEDMVLSTQVAVTADPVDTSTNLATAHAVQVRVWSCSAAYTASSGANPTYTCTGTETELTSDWTEAPFTSLATISNLAAGSNRWLRIETRISPDAPSGVQGETATLSYQLALHQHGSANV